MGLADEALQTLQTLETLQTFQIQDDPNPDLTNFINLNLRNLSDRDLDDIIQLMVEEHRLRRAGRDH